MTRNASCHLLDILAEVPDPRHKKGRRYPLVSILALIVIGLMSNHKGYTLHNNLDTGSRGTGKSVRFQIKEDPMCQQPFIIFSSVLMW